MREPLLKLEVVKRGTHILPVSEWNNDVPSPCECVAEALFDLEYRISELVKIGGYDPKKIGPMSENAYAFDSLISSVKNLTHALNAATKQNWKLDVPLHPNIMEHVPTDPIPFPHCVCVACESARAAKGVL